MNSREIDADSRRALARAGAAKLGRSLLMIAMLVLGAQATQAKDVVCGVAPTYTLPEPDAKPPSDLPDLIVKDGACTVPLGKTYYFKNVNILNKGTLFFHEVTSATTTHFWASSIIIENGGTVRANAQTGPAWSGFGAKGSVLTIHLYGKNDRKGVLCRSPVGTGQSPAPCGILQAHWDNNGTSQVDLPGRRSGLPVRDYFYRYGPLHGDEDGYFGNKVLAVSYGGTLDLQGYKGVIGPDEGPLGNKYDDNPLNSGRSWRRLADGQSLAVGATTLYLQNDNNLPDLRWGANDEIVVTTTDYLPRHSEKLKVKRSPERSPEGLRVDFDAVDNPEGKTGVLWPHNGVRYGGPKDIYDKPGGPKNVVDKQWKNRLPARIRDSIDPELRDSGAETRAAVALLTRSIQIVSAGDVAGQDFPKEDSHYFYGAHMVIRQGFQSVQIRGVEFRQMGQGGRLGHYPIHFHMVRLPPDGTYVKDSSINESMTRWIVLHATADVTLARNVGYKSIGHGFYLEDGTETLNRFYSNIGIFARAAVATVDPQTKKQQANPQNPRMVPGILADNQNPDDPKFAKPNVANPGFPYRSDSEYPTVFWINNGWNDFVGNVAAGAGTCGAAYWLVPASNKNMAEVRNDANKGQMIWSGYAGLQGRPGFGGATPLKSFYKNHATSTMHSFQTTDDAPPCDGVVAADAPIPDNFRVLQAIRSNAERPARHDVYDEVKKQNINVPNPDADMYYPHVVGGARMATRCAEITDGFDLDPCSPRYVPSKCGTGPDPTKDPMRRCDVVVLDHYTSSFHWAHGNVSAIWLRPQWYLVTNSVLSDVQNGGLSFVTGGDYTHSSMINGYWGLVRNTVFIGNTNNNPDNTKNSRYAANTGPFNAASKLGCDLIEKKGAPQYCLNSDEGISMPASGFFTNQRLLNIYDGPFYQDSNAYLDITTADCDRSKGENSDCMYGKGPAVLLLRKVPGGTDPKACYLPNAAIGWKQRNGFFYPPAFHSKNLFFDNVDLRHYVIVPLFQPNTYLTDEIEANKQYCIAPKTMFNNWTAIDRQTELNDDDGTLTGLTNSLKDGHLKQTISINEDPFFSAPVETAECASALGANADSANACSSPNARLPPVTARTSPYDYVTTVIYHKSTDQNADPWGEDCANELCYGVPLFRQSLTDATDGKDRTKATKEMRAWYDKNCDKQTVGAPPNPGCRWPLIRMAGASLSQRNTLTINNGVYYIDTTVSAKMQRDEKYASDPARGATSLNAFTPGQKYHVFFVYAKQSTAQTYEIYVGKNFKIGEQFELTNVNIETKDLKFLPAKTKWASPEYDPATGILRVHINFQGLTTLDPTPANGLCAPRLFCQPSGTNCVSSLKNNDRLYKESNAVCSYWAVKDLDCPPLVYDNKQWIGGGCPGFSFTLPPDFTADDKHHRPQPKSYSLTASKDQGQPDWGTRFLTAPLEPDNTKGRCFYQNPPDRSCPKP